MAGEAGAVRLPERLAHSLRAAGEAGDRWLAALPELLANLEADWSITVGGALAGGNAAYVAEATRADGSPVVLKVALPAISGFSPFGQELRTLRMADGDPYVALLRFDPSRQAMLLERLGEPLGRLGWPVPQQLDALVNTVARGWRPIPAATLPDPDALPDGAAKARWLADFVVSGWEELSRPCPEATIAEAARCAAARAAAWIRASPSWCTATRIRSICCRPATGRSGSSIRRAWPRSPRTTSGSSCGTSTTTC